MSTAASIRSPELVVSEIFGPTIQGEGPSAGRRASFVRLGRCDLTCRWCDTPYTWDWQGRNGVVYDPAVELRRRPVGDVLARLRRDPTGLVVITGGEPLLQRRAVTQLVDRLLDHGCAVEIETNGRHGPIVRPDRPLVHNVSPKLGSSGVARADRVRPDVLSAFVNVDAIFKFVCGAEGDLDEVADIAAEAGLPAHRIWILPLGTEATMIERTLRTLADHVVDRGWNLSTRLHVHCWGDERAR